jgi:hypothetical protein
MYTYTLKYHCQNSAKNTQTISEQTQKVSLQYSKHKPIATIMMVNHMDLLSSELLPDERYRLKIPVKFKHTLKCLQSKLFIRMSS